MVTIPKPDEEEARRRRAAEEAKIAANMEADRARNLARLETAKRLESFNPPVLGPRPVIPQLGYDVGGNVDPERRYVPPVDDPIRDAPAVAESPAWDASLAIPAAPEGSGIFGVGSGGPLDQSGGLTEEDIVSLRDYRAKRDADRSALAVRETLSRTNQTPEQLAEALELSERTGSSLLEVETNLPSFRMADSASRIDLLRESAPKLRTWLDDRTNLELSHDDTENLGWWESLNKSFGDAFARTDALKAERGSRDGAGMGALTDYPLGGDLRPGVADGSGIAYGAAVTGGALKSGFATTTSGIYGLARSASELNDQFASWVAGRKLESVPSQWLAERQQAAKISADEWMPKVDDPTLQGALQGIQSLPTSALTIATGIMTGGASAPIMGAAVAGGVTAGDEYGTAREQGMDPLSSAGYGATQGILEAAWEVPQLKFLIGDINKQTPFGEMLFKQALVQGVTEQGATHTQDFVSWAILPANKDKTIDDYIAERPAAAYQTLIASMVGTGVQTTTAKLLDEGMKAIDEGYQQKRAEEIANMVRAMGDKAADSKLLKRMPDKYREAVAAVTKDGPLENIRVDGEAFSELAQEKGVTVERLAQAFRIDPAEAQTAIDAGQDVVIPSGNYAAVIQTGKKELGIAGTEIHTALAPNIRLRADDFTAKEAAAMKQAAADMATQQEDPGFADAADRVREDSRQTLASTGRFNAETTAVQSAIPAELIITLAERTNQDPEKLWSDYKASVESKVQVEQDELAQGMERVPVPIDDRELELASKELEPKQFEAWKAAREGLSNPQIAERMNEAEPDAIYSADDVKVWLYAARKYGYDSQKTAVQDRGLSVETQRVINMKARDVANKDIAQALYPDRETAKARNQVNVLVNRHKALIAERRQALSGELAQEKSLPMDEASRMVRARAMGFDVDTPLYHGTARSFDEFRRDGGGSHTSMEPDAREALYFTTNPAIASDYAAEAAYRTSGNGANVVPVYARLKNPLILENYTDAGDNPTYVEVLRAAKAAGHDGVIFKGTDHALTTNGARGGAAYAIFDPSNVRSIWAAFDPSEQGSGNLLAQEQTENRGGFTGMNLSQEAIIRLYESANLSTFVHETAHWYLTTLEKMARLPDAHPFVIEQLASIRNWAGKHPEFEIYDANGQITEEGVQVHEAFAETFEAYMREGKAPSTAMRSVFAAFKSWLMRVYRSIAEIGGRVRLDAEITAVLDRALATDEAIAAARKGMDKNAEAMAQAMLDKGVITQRQYERTKERLLAAREKAEADLMARLMEQYERNQKVWWREEERDVRRDVQSEIDERPEQRAYQVFTGEGWRDTLEGHVERAAQEELFSLNPRSFKAIREASPEDLSAWFDEKVISVTTPGRGTLLRLSSETNGEQARDIEIKFSETSKDGFSGFTVDMMFEGRLSGMGESSPQSARQGLAVFNRTVAAIKEHMRRTRPEYVVFTGSGEEQSKLYDFLVRSFSFEGYEGRIEHYASDLIVNDASVFGISDTKVFTLAREDIATQLPINLENPVVQDGQTPGGFRQVSKRLNWTEIVQPEPRSAGAPNGGRDQGRGTDAGRDAGAQGELGQSETVRPSLVVMHNLTEQNLLHANEIGGLAAPSLAVVDTDKGVLNNFGEISLIAKPDILGSGGVKTFDSDIYSPRHPRPEYEINEASARKVSTELKAATAELGDLREIDWDGVSRDGPSVLSRNDTVRAAFFKERGELPARLPRKKLPEKDGPQIKTAAKLDILDGDMWTVRESPEIISLATEYFTQQVKMVRDTGDAETADYMDDKFFYEEDGKRLLDRNYIQRFIMDARLYRKAMNREVDTIELGSMLSKKLRDKKTNQAFEEYVERLAARVITGKTLFRGITYSGNRRYSDYTMENILREMTRELQGGEKWNYGAGSIRARYANQLKSLTAIRARKGQLVPEGEMEAAKTEAQDRLTQLLSDLKPYYRFGGGNAFIAMDDMSKAIAEGPQGIREAFDFKGEQEPQQQIREFLDYLTGLPTEYFEAKAQRAVGLNEFAAAVVPRGTSERALELLRGAGLQIRYYTRNDAADRARAVRGVPEALFHTGTRKGRVASPPSVPPMRLDLRAVEEQYGPEALAALPPKVRAHSASATDADQFVALARDVQATLKKKAPRSLSKFLSNKRTIGEGYDKITYSGIRDPDGEILAMIGKRNEARGLIATPENDSKKSRSYSYEEAAHAAWEEGFFNGESPPEIAEFLDALRADFDGTAKLYRSADQGLVQQIDNANEWANWFDQNEIDINEENDAVLRAAIETKLSSQAENAIGPDEAAPFFKMPDGRALLEGLKQGTQRDKLIRDETRRRMIERHGDIFNDGTIMQAAEAFARNEVQQRQYEIELEALSNASGKQAAANLARETARELLRDKQVREVLNYNQWLILSERWGKKALEAAEKGDFAKAAEAKRYQIINLAMFREGRKLAEKIESTRKHLLDYSKKAKQVRLLEAGKEYQEQMNWLLDDYQFRPESKKGENKRSARGEWIRAQMASLDPYAAYQDATKTDAEKQVEAAEALERSQMLANLAEGTEAKNFKSITVDELLSVRDEADMIWKLATLKDRLIKEGERRRLSLAAGDIAAEVYANQPNEKPPEPAETDSPGYKLKRSVFKYFAMHRTLQSLSRQFAGDKDNGVFWRYIVRPLNEAFARLSSIRKEMGADVDKLFSAYTKDEQRRMFRDRQTFDFRQSGGPRITLSKQGRMAFALNWGNAKNRQRLMDSLGIDVGQVRQVLNTLDKRDWDFIQATWDYLDTWFPEANRVHESVHGAPMDKEDPLEIATRFGIYRGGYYPIKFDPMLSSKTGQRQMEADAKTFTGQVGARSTPGFTKARVKGKVTLPLRLSVLDVITSHLDQVAVSIATEEALFDAGRLIKQPAVENAIIERHGREVYNTIVNTLVTAKFGLEGANGVLAHLRNGATVVGLGWKVSTALLQPLGISNSIVRVGGFWIAKGYARMGKDAATIQSSANWIMERSEFMRNRRQSNSPEMQALRGKLKAGVTDIRIPGVVMTKGAIDAVKNSAFAMMANTQFYSVDMPTWYGAYFKAQAAGMNETDAVAEADQAVIDSQGGGELHQTAAMQTGAGTRYAAALRLLTNFMSYMVTTYNLSVMRIRSARTIGQIAALGFDLAIMLAVPVAGKMMLDAWTKGGDDDEDEIWEKYMREQAAFLLSPFVGISQIAGSTRGDDSYGYRGPAGLGIFAEASRAGAAAAEGDFDESFWRPANKTAGMIFHYPASQLDATIRGAQAYFNGETENPAAFLVGPPPAN